MSMNRVNSDLRKLKKKGYNVEMIKINDDMQEFYVEFHGPINTLYHGHVWKTKVRLSNYPFSPPSVFFIEKIFHPNIASSNMWKCEGYRVDLRNCDWNVLNDLVYVYEMVIPQLLAEPNTSQPLNKEAAYMFTEDRARYEKVVKGHCRRYAKTEDAGAIPEQSTSSDKKVAA